MPKEPQDQQRPEMAITEMAINYGLKTSTEFYEYIEFAKRYADKQTASLRKELEEAQTESVRHLTEATGLRFQRLSLKETIERLELQMSEKDREIEGLTKRINFLLEKENDW